MKTVETLRLPLRNAPLWPLSVSAYRVLGETGLIPKNTELLYGFVYRKMSKSPHHCFLSARLARWLQSVVKPGWLVRIEQPITGSDSEPEPDCAVVRGVETDYCRDHPRTAELVIEVCVTSLDYDRSKLPAYAAAGVKECWLVLGEQRQVEVYRQPAGDRYAEHLTIGPGGRLASMAVPECILELETLFARE